MMPYRLEREKTDLTPYVLIDEERGYMVIEGESYHENVFNFFSEITEWLKRFLSTDFPEFTFDCELRYFNSSTVRILLNMLLEMDKSAGSERIVINWITTTNNWIIIECGEDFQDGLKNVTFNLVTKDPVY